MNSFQFSMRSKIFKMIDSEFHAGVSGSSLVEAALGLMQQHLQWLRKQHVSLTAADREHEWTRPANVDGDKSGHLDPRLRTVQTHSCFGGCGQMV